MSRQGSGFSSHRDRREGHQRQYGIGSWYGTGDYYPPSSNSNEFGLPAKRPRYSDRYKDRHENPDDVVQLPQQDADYGPYADLNAVSEKDKQVIGDSTAGRNFGSRRASSEYHHNAHRIPKNFWSSENAVHQCSYTASTGIQMRHHSGYGHESLPGNRGDSGYTWRAHPYSSKGLDIRFKSSLYPEVDNLDELRQRPGWVRADEGRVYAGSGRSAYVSKSPAKFSIQRDVQKLGFSRHSKKNSDGEPVGVGAAAFERSHDQKEYHVTTKKQAQNMVENKMQEMQRLESSQRHERGDERGDERERRLSEVKQAYGEQNVSKSNENVVIASENCDEDAQVQSVERRKLDLLAFSDGKTMQESITDVPQAEAVAWHTHPTPSHCGNEVKIDLQQPQFENVSPVPDEDDAVSQSQIYVRNDNFVNLIPGAVLHIEDDQMVCDKDAEHTAVAESSQMGAVAENVQAGAYQPPKSEEEVLSKLDSMDKEIVECEEDIKNLGKIEAQLEKELVELKKEIDEDESEVARKEEDTGGHQGERDPKDEIMEYFNDKFRPKDFQLVVKIYKDNQIKAKISHAQLWPSNFASESSSKPLYYQPSDLPFYFDNIRRHKRFKKKLVKFLQMKKIAQNRKKDVMRKVYEQQKEGWLKKLERIESNIKRKTKLVKVRAFYEREFPEIKRQREQQERMTRFGARTTWGPLARSEAEFEEIVDNLSVLEATEKQMHQLAIEPPKLLDKYERRAQFSNKNGLIVDLEAFERERKFKNIWCEEEKAIFKERFMQFPKDFEKIAEGLKRKTISECVLYYYRNKKKENFKATSKKPSKKTGRLQRQLVSTLTYAQPLPSIDNSQQPQPVKTRQKERERLREQDQPKEHGGERQRVLRSDQESADKNENRSTRELRSSDEKHVEVSEVHPSNEITGNKLLTQTMETQCKQTVDDLIARYLARKPLPAENVDPSRWSELEISKAIEGLKCHGRNWPAISRMVHTKSEAQCKNFYFNYKRKFHLESILGISKHPITSFHHEGSVIGNDDEISGRRRRAKRTAQHEPDSNVPDYVQAAEQGSQDKPVDVEEIEVDQSTNEENALDTQTNESKAQGNKAEIVFGQDAGSKPVDDDSDSKGKLQQMVEEKEKKENVERETVDADGKSAEGVSVQRDSRDMAVDQQNLVDKPFQATSVIKENSQLDSYEENTTDQLVTVRPDSLRLDDIRVYSKDKNSPSGQSVRAQPPPLTPVIAHKAMEQCLDPERAESPSSVMKGISLQSEIGAFKETLERTLDKKNELAKSNTAVSLKDDSENKTQFVVSTPYSRPQGERLAGQTPLQHPQKKYMDGHKHVERFPFLPSPSLEQSAAIQAFAGRQPSLMSLQQSQVKQFGHLSQEAAAIQKHYQHSHRTNPHDASHGTLPPTSIGHPAHSHRSSPKLTASASQDPRENSPFASSRPAHFMYPAASSMASAHGTHNADQIRHSDENAKKYPAMSEYPGMPRKSILLTNTANPNEMYARHEGPYEGLHQAPVERQFPYFESRYPGDARVRAYSDLLERSAVIPSLRHASPDMVRPPNALSKDNVSHAGSQLREQAAVFGLEARQQQMYLGALMSSRERVDDRVPDRREQVLTDQARIARQEHAIGNKHGVDNASLKSNERSVASPVTAMDPRMGKYLPTSLPSHLSQFMRDRDGRPTLDHQLLQGIDGRKIPGGIHHQSSGLPQDERIPQRRKEMPSGRDEYRRQQQQHLDSMPRADQRGIAELQRMQALRDAGNMYQNSQSFLGMSNVASTDHLSRSEQGIAYDSRYGISTGRVRQTPGQLSMTGLREYRDDMMINDRPLIQPQRMAMAGLTNEEIEHLKERGIIPTKRTSAIKSQSKNTRPSSVDSVIHKSFLTERQQQLSSSLGDLRNLTALHLSPNLPISPVSASYNAKKTSFMFRPWEQEKIEGENACTKSASGSDAISRDDILTKRRDSQTNNCEKQPISSSETTFDEPLMSPTIPFTDRARDTPVKDLNASSEDIPVFFASQVHEGKTKDKSMIENAQHRPTHEHEYPPAQLLNVTPVLASSDRPSSPVDSEATLSADEVEMEMMQESLNERERTLTAGKESLSGRNFAMSIATDSLKMVERESSRGKAVVVQCNEGKIYENESYGKQSEQSDLSADLEVSRITGNHEESSKFMQKGRKKSKSNAKLKRRSPKGNVKVKAELILMGTKADASPLLHVPHGAFANTDSKLTRMVPCEVVGSEHEATAAVTCVPVTENDPSLASSSLSSAMPSVGHNDAVPCTIRQDEILPSEADMKEGMPGTEEKTGPDNDVNEQDNHNIVDVEETSAAIDSIQNDGQDSPSAEEDMVEPYLTLWSSAEGYPCEEQPVPNAVDTEYPQEFDMEARDNVGTNEKEQSNNFEAGYLKERSSNNDVQENSARIAMELQQARLSMDINLGFQQSENVMLPTQADNDIFLSEFETTPISPPGSPISPAETQAMQQRESTPADIALSFSHSVLSLNVTSQNSPRVPANPVAFPFSTLSFPYSTLSSMPASRSDSMHGSGSSSACPSPNPVGSMQNSPSYAASSANLITRTDFHSAGQHGDHLRNLTEKLLNNEMAMSQDDHMTLEVTNKSLDASENFSSTITYEPLSDED